MDALEACIWSLREPMALLHPFLFFGGGKKGCSKAIGEKSPKSEILAPIKISDFERVWGDFGLKCQAVDPFGAVARAA